MMFVSAGDASGEAHCSLSGSGSRIGSFRGVAGPKRPYPTLFNASPAGKRPWTETARHFSRHDNPSLNLGRLTRVGDRSANRSSRRIRATIDDTPDGLL